MPVPIGGSQVSEGSSGQPPILVNMRIFKAKQWSHLASGNKSTLISNEGFRDFEVRILSKLLSVNLLDGTPSLDSSTVDSTVEVKRYERVAIEYGLSGVLD